MDTSMAHLLHLRLRDHGGKSVRVEEQSLPESETLRNVRIYTLKAHQHGCRKQDRRRTTIDRMTWSGKGPGGPPPHTHTHQQSMKKEAMHLKKSKKGYVVRFGERESKRKMM